MQSFIGCCLLILFSPLLLVIAVVLLISARQPVLFTQMRLGKYRNPFMIYKFRTMQAGHITKMGRLLRATGLDELPQLFNIIKGDMCFVGPRPLMLQDVIRLGWQSPYYDIRWSVPPGITGLAQLSKQCHRKVTWMYDCAYIKQRSVCLDFYCIFRSVLIPVIGKHWGKRLTAHIKHTHRP